MSETNSAAVNEAAVHAGPEGMHSVVPHLPSGRELDPSGGLALDALPTTADAYPATLALHADEAFELSTDVAPPIHVSTTYRYSEDPNQLISSHDRTSYGPTEYIYSRMTAPSTTRLEALLTSLLRSPSPVLAYSSGLAAIYAILTFFTPRTISIGDGYHGSHGVLSLYKRLTKCKILPLDCPASDLNKGDLIMLETPVNPTGQAFNIAAFAEKAHSRGAYLMVDSTFAPPPIQDPFVQGADVVMHSGTKYIGGHSDMLCGVIAVKHPEWVPRMLEDRGYLGSVMGGLESWLGVRSVRTLELRVERQARNCAEIVAWLHNALSNETTPPPRPPTTSDPTKAPFFTTQATQTIRSALSTLSPHSSIQALPSHPDHTWLSTQMPNDLHSPVFSLLTHTELQARSLPSHLKYFHHATSLGGVESLIEWRCMSDRTCDRRLVRVSVGVEDVRDLMSDLLKAFGGIAKLQEGTGIGSEEAKFDWKELH